MSRTKEKDWKQKLFSLDIETIRKLEYLASQQEISQSAYIDWLISKTYAHTDLGKKADELQKEIEYQNTVQAEAGRVKARIIAEVEQLKGMQEVEVMQNKEVLKQKKMFVDCLIAKIKSKRSFTDVMEYARNQSLTLNGKYSPEELYKEAVAQIK